MGVSRNESVGGLILSNLCFFFFFFLISKKGVSFTIYFYFKIFG